MRRLLPLFCSLALLLPMAARGQDLPVDPQRARAVRWTAAGAGAAVGAGIGLATVTDEGLFRPGADPVVVRWVSVGGVGAQTLSSTFATGWFADTVLRHPRRPWRSIGWGMLYGMAAGAMSYGLGFGTLVTLGWATDTVSVGEVVDHWYIMLPLNYGAGGFLGATTCIPVGALLAPTIAWTMRW